MGSGVLVNARLGRFTQEGENSIGEEAAEMVPHQPFSWDLFNDWLSIFHHETRLTPRRQRRFQMTWNRLIFNGCGFPDSSHGTSVRFKGKSTQQALDDCARQFHANSFWVPDWTYFSIRCLHNPIHSRSVGWHENVSGYIGNLSLDGTMQAED